MLKITIRLNRVSSQIFNFFVRSSSIERAYALFCTFAISYWQVCLSETRCFISIFWVPAGQSPDVCTDRPVSKWFTHFTGRSCERCKCLADGGIGCKPLCGGSMRCPPGQHLETYGEAKDKEEPRCVCRLKKCVQDWP